MLLNNNSLIMQWNRDENGNPMSWHIPLEVQQISPTHGVIQLVQVPDQHQRIASMLTMEWESCASMKANTERWLKLITMVVG